MKKTALVTGFDNSIIARETALKLIKLGYRVIATYEENRFNDEFLKIHNLDNEILFEQVDMHCKDSINELISRISDYSFNAIINCYATLSTKPTGELRNEFLDFDYDSFNSVVSKNITSLAAICIGLKDSISQGGCIINITSSAAEEGAFATISYNLSKAAVKSLTQSLANNFGTYKEVRVNCVAPGWIPQSKDVVAGNIVELANKITPLSNYGNAENVVEAIISLLENPYANNVNYSVDGGITSSYLMYMLEAVELYGINTDYIMKDLINQISSVKDHLKNE